MIIRYTDDTKTTFMTPCIFIFTSEKKIRKKDEKKRSEERTKKISNPFLIIFILDSFLLFLFPPHLPCFFFPRSLIFAYLKKVPWKEDIQDSGEGIFCSTCASLHTDINYILRLRAFSFNEKKFPSHFLFLFFRTLSLFFTFSIHILTKGLASTRGYCVQQKLCMPDAVDSQVVL